jgi:uncharacterized membrane protein
MQTVPLSNFPSARQAARFTGLWANRPTTGLAAGDVAYFTDIGKGLSPWAWSAALSRWVPTAPIKAFENTALITGLQQTAEQILLQWTIPPGLLTGLVWSMGISWGRDNATDAFGTINFRYGTAGTVADLSIATANLSSIITGTTRSSGASTWQRSASATTVEKVGTANLGTSFASAGSGATLATPSTVSNQDSNTLIVSLTTTMSAATATKPQIGYSFLEIQP